MSGRRFLIVNADDFGRSPGINSGIIKAHIEGIVTSTTLMVNLPWTLGAVEMARARPTLAVGLHLNFCYGSPVADASSVPSLLNCSGYFETSLPLLSETAQCEEIHIEASAQLECFRTLMGRDPSHVDSHKYLHSYAPFLAAVVALAEAEGLPVRAICDADRAQLRDCGVATTDAFAGRFHGLDGDGVSLEVLTSVIDHLEEGWTELMCHPGIVDEHLLDSSYCVDREHELAVLCSATVRDALVAGHVKLATFLELTKGQ